MNQEAGLQDVPGFLLGARGLSVTGTQSGEPSHFWNCSCSGGRWASLEESDIHLQVGSLPREEMPRLGLLCWVACCLLFFALHSAVCRSTCTLSCAIFSLTGMQAPGRQLGSGFLISILRVECSVDACGLRPYLAQLLLAGWFYHTPYQMQVF